MMMHTAEAHILIIGLNNYTKINSELMKTWSFKEDVSSQP